MKVPGNNRLCGGKGENEVQFNDSEEERGTDL